MYQVPPPHTKPTNYSGGDASLRAACCIYMFLGISWVDSVLFCDTYLNVGF